MDWKENLSVSQSNYISFLILPWGKGGIGDCQKTGFEEYSLMSFANSNVKIHTKLNISNSTRFI